MVEQNVINPQKIREDFPALHQQVNGKPLIYLDNAATTQRPQSVINTITNYYRNDNANVHRGVHTLSARATKAYEGAREKLRHFINAEHAHEIIFVRGTTEGINLVAQSYGRSFLKPDDEIIITYMEHHSNIVPWQMVCEQTGAKLKVVPITNNGELILEDYAKLLTEKTKFVSIPHVSNVLGTINPIKQMIAMAHALNIPVLVDGCQAAPHLTVDVQELDADFYIFSAHKMYGPSGIGIVYGKTKYLEKMPPYQGGGYMVSRVRFEKTDYNKLPFKFEAGSPNTAAVIGFGAAVDYLQTVGVENAAAYEQELLVYAQDALASVAGLRILGNAAEKVSVISFLMDGMHAHDLGTILDHEGIAIRVGHHCAMPLMEHFGVPATARASFVFYNTPAEIDALVVGLEKANAFFK